MNRVQGILLGLLTFSIAGGAIAADSKGQFAMKGAGFLSCQVFAAEREKRSDVYYLIGGWIEGFVTAHNRYATDTFDITAFESTEMLLTVMQNHCKDHPDDRLFPVLNSMLLQLQPDRLKSESERVTVTSGERKALLYVETIRRIQENLKKRGLYKGAVDGKFTGPSEAALMAFQSDAGLEKTGFPDQVTLWRLFRK
jgi:hypothetical protein